jgi:hypothetical protein
MQRTFRLATIAALLCAHAHAATLWIEAEKPAASQMARHPWWYDKVKTDELAGGDFISNWSADKIGEATYRIEATQAGSHEFWVRANPIQTTMTYSLNGAADIPIDLKKNQDSVNIAADDKPDLRFIAWVNVGRVTLKAGVNTLRFHMTSANNHHGMLDCFVLSTEPFQPNGKSRPGEIAAKTAAAEQGWFAFNPPPDPFTASAIDLRLLNEKVAGELGRIATRGDEFIHSANNQPVRFWAVNGPPHNATGDALKKAARRLAKYGVNLVRAHGAVFDKTGEVDVKKVAHLHEVVAAMKAEGIYTHISFYFPLWFTPAADHPWMKGYDGKTHPFASLMFNPDFQQRHRDWLRAILTTPDKDGRKLIDEPALFGFEIQNEDSFFFWTFDSARIPDAQLRLLETQFAAWLKKKHGSLDAALAHWKNQTARRDNLAEGRVGFRPLYNIFNEKSARDRDTAQFLFETQQKFYADTIAYARQLGFKGLITPSNWATASPEVFGPLEKWSYATGDFIDRHGYFGGTHKGENAEWSVRAGHTYGDRSALRFESGTPGKPRQFVHPLMDITYAHKPQMLSETTWTRPNRYRTEAPLYIAAFGALQGSDAIVHFAFDGADWAVKPGYFMQPWTLMAPSQVGQFPATALIYRLGLVTAGDTLAKINLNTNDLLALRGTPLPQDASFDELRLKDVPKGTDVKPGQRIDPLIHYAGRVEVDFTGEPTRTELKDLAPFIDRAAQVVRSSTRELTLDYGKGLLTVNAASAQAASGNLKTAGAIELRDLTVQCDLDLAHLILVPLDREPIAKSRRLLLQVMSEEKPSGFLADEIDGGLKRIRNIGRDPWRVKELSGTVRFKSAVKIQPLDFNGYPAGAATTGTELKLSPQTVYYLVTRE